MYVCVCAYDRYVWWWMREWSACKHWKHTLSLSLASDAQLPSQRTVHGDTADRQRSAHTKTCRKKYINLLLVLYFSSYFSFIYLSWSITWCADDIDSSLFILKVFFFRLLLQFRSTTTTKKEGITKCIEMSCLVSISTQWRHRKRSWRTWTGDGAWCRLWINVE